ncbi:hypothetical protein EDD16DRAFT_1527737 [Pisolithus croceorrhizus]|nr:hypothetical protein EDD16DRAFT_1527737 [Pisolithus croceorrhizus]KAI6101393.1 hypothetical protein EV401DRAFT_1894206 [Pisolithus croceorrhizus]
MKEQCVPVSMKKVWKHVVVEESMSPRAGEKKKHVRAKSLEVEVWSICYCHCNRLAYQGGGTVVANASESGGIQKPRGTGLSFESESQKWLAVLAVRGACMRHKGHGKTEYVQLIQSYYPTRVAGLKAESGQKIEGQERLEVESQLVTPNTARTMKITWAVGSGASLKAPESI